MNTPEQMSCQQFHRVTGARVVCLHAYRLSKGAAFAAPPPPPVASHVTSSSPPADHSQRACSFK